MPDQTGRRRGITAVVVTYNSAGHLADFFDTLPAAFAGAPPYELVLVDNASADGTASVAQSLAPEATVIRSGDNLGYSGGINLGLRNRSMTGPVLVLNPDVRLQPGSVARLLAGLGEAGVGIAVPRMVAPDGHTHLSLRRDPSILRALGEAVLGGQRAGRFGPLGEMITDHRVYEGRFYPDWATGAVMLIGEACADTVGPWDESYFLYSEETDYAIRARSSGYRLVYVPEAVALHIGGESNTSTVLWPLLVQNRMRMYRKFHGPLISGAFGLVVLANEVARAFTGRATSRAAVKAILTRAPVRPSRVATVATAATSRR